MGVLSLKVDGGGFGVYPVPAVAQSGQLIRSHHRVTFAPEHFRSGGRAMPVEKQWRTVKPTPLRGNLKEEELRRAVQTVKVRREAREAQARSAVEVTARGTAEPEPR
jgi:hypothetical protein